MVSKTQLDNTSKRLAGVQVYFNFIGEMDRLNAATEAHRVSCTGDVRILTVEVILTGQKPEIPWDDKIVIEVAHPAWYKAAAINVGARHLLRDGYEYIAWFDSDSFVTPALFAGAAIDLLDKYPIIQLGDALTETDDTGTPQTRPTIATRLLHQQKLDGFHNDGGAWAACGDFFRDVGLWPYSVVDGGNKVLLYPFMPAALANHPLILSVQNTEVGEDLEAYWSKLNEWLDGRSMTALPNHQITMLPHGSRAGRLKVWAFRYGLYKQIRPGKNIILSAEGIPEVTDDRIRSYLDLILRERAFPSQK